jgi:hypothetical protein
VRSLRAATVAAALPVLLLAACGGNPTTSGEPPPSTPPSAEPAPAPPSVEPVPPPPSPEESVPDLETAPELVSVTLERTGGVASPAGGERWEIVDPDALAHLRALLPEPVPKSFDTTSPCADCFVYELVVSPRLVGVTLIYRFDDVTFPEELRPLVEAIIGP